MRISAETAIKEKQETAILTNFSKMWNPGDHGIVLYPVFKDEASDTWHLLVNRVRGHKVDLKALSLKTTFIPSNCEFDEYGQPKDGVGDTAYQFSRIAKCFVEGQKASEIKQLEGKNFPSESMRNQAIRQIEDKFDPQKMSSVKPVVRALTYFISTECLYIPMKDGKPDPMNAKLCTQELSDKRINKLVSLIRDERYTPDDEHPYLEVEYTFPTGEKQQAGQTEPTGITNEYKLNNKYPDAYTALTTQIQGLPTSSNMIEHRNRAYRKFSEQQIKSALAQYAILSTQYLDSLEGAENEEFVERLKKNCGIVEDLGITKSLKNESLVASLKEAIEEQHSKQAMEEATRSEMDQNETEESGVEETSTPMTVEQMLAEDHLGSEEDLSGLSLDD